MSLPCPIQGLIPQKGKMGFNQTLIKAKIEDGEGTALINPDNIFINDQNELSNIVLIEYVNQLVAGIQGYNEKYHNKKVEKGLFVGIQEAEFFQTVHSGDALTLKGAVSEEISQVTFVEGVIERSGEKIARLVTKLYEVKNIAEFESLLSMGAASQNNIVMKPNDKKPQAWVNSSMRRKIYSYIHEMETGEDFISFKFACPEDFEPFDGHFPGNPLLPGIVLLEIGNLALELFMDRPVVINYVKKMKIAGVVLPNQVISCNIKIDRSDTAKLAFSASFIGDNGREISRYNGYSNLN